MKKFKTILVFIGLTYFSLAAIAQNHAIGIRFSDDFGISYKQKLHGSTWVEGIAHIHEHSIAITGLYEKYQQTPFSKYFDWYYGGGAYLGIWSVNNESHAFGGVRGVLGLCYRFTDIPFDISLDWMPTIQLFNDYGTDFVLFGLSIRYTF